MMVTKKRSHLDVCLLLVRGCRRRRPELEKDDIFMNPREVEKVPQQQQLGGG
jgi:hypothetical protein